MRPKRLELAVTIYAFSVPCLTLLILLSIVATIVAIADYSYILPFR